MPRARILVLAIAITLSGCTANQTAGQVGDGRALYDQAIDRSAVYQEANVRRLAPLAYPVRALSLTGNTAWAAGKEGQKVTIDSPYGLWISVEPELQAICRTYPRDQVIDRLHQLLGLKPATDSDRSARFIRFTIEEQKTGPAVTGVFRPCANPDPTATQCGNQITTKPEQAAYVSWFANQMVFSYKRDASMGGTGYPWTRLGYTYNWDPAAADIRGVQEYVVPDKTVVTVTEIVTPEDYCAP
ncbi:hypothetical protein [Azospirillum rugosum]|uniref:Group 4 capsule polysaccharide lipoprotein gfcB, YjbF n=1 Tax=Azospirillum rugosum TaxID=416170 RepID=A0ABS4SKV3_9PROT|nr:hypothetical protein [Azospirillum rugosum]MBP2293184.1 hypothetical protein [Azospirillum rugosum]MDQ0526733.1 hypothetical protein [Azospirillum rugosum]